MIMWCAMRWYNETNVVLGKSKQVKDVFKLALRCVLQITYYGN